MRPTGHTVLITGGATGIGLALATRFHQAGNTVIVVGRRQDALDAACARLPGLTARTCDITDPSCPARLVNEFPDVSVLVNNAGVQRNGNLANLGAADVTNELAVNFAAPVTLTHAFLPHLVQRSEAAVVNVSSVLAMAPKQSAPIYCAGKAAIRSFTRTLRWQLEGTPVRVFDLTPPLVDTAMTAGRGSGKVSPEVVADAFWMGFTTDRPEIFVGKARAMRLVNRLSPALAGHILRNG